MLNMKTSQKVYLYGRNALIEALSAKPAAVRKVFLDPKYKNDPELVLLLKKNRITPLEMKGESQGKVEKSAVHQGVIAEIDTAGLFSELEIVLSKESNTKKPAFVLLDELEDPHNVGAIIRSAAAFGATAVLLPEHHQAQITGAVIKTSAGMVFRIPLVSIGNVNQTLRLLKEKGFWIYGLATGGDTTLPRAVFDTPSVFVIGNEGAGIREKTLELCDIRLSIPMDPRCESLNAAVSASVVLYEWKKQKDS